MKSLHLVSLLPAVFGFGCAIAPTVTLTADAFPVSNVSTESYAKGQQIGDESFPPLQRLAESSMTILEGRWAAKGETVYGITGTYYGAQKHRWWSIEVCSQATRKQRKAIAEAASGCEIELGWAVNASLRICPRFERKSFPWGQAVSFLAQYQNDNTTYVPNNGMLSYEVHGVTQDGKYVRARFGVTHPKLAEFGSGVRDYRDNGPADLTSPMRKDPHYRLVEAASAESFEPSLAEIDRFLGTLKTAKP